MTDVQMSDRPQMTWVPVVDETGRTRMEARWLIASPMVGITHAA